MEVLLGNELSAMAFQYNLNLILLVLLESTIYKMSILVKCIRGILFSESTD
jgi:hypothetical protein